MPSAGARRNCFAGDRLWDAVPDQLVLGHGAGGGIEAADLVAVAAVVTAVGWRVVLVEQPWRVAG